MKAVHIFRGIHGVENSLRVHLRRQRHLHQDAVHVVAAIQFADDAEQFRSCVIEAGGVSRKLASPSFSHAAILLLT